MKSSGKPGKLYEVFYVKNGVTQYFIKPLKLKTDEVKFSVDFTVKSNVEPKGNLTCNFSLLSEKPIKKVGKVLFSNNGQQVSLDNLEKVFLEKQDKKYHLRYTSTMTFDAFSQLTKSGFSTILVDNISFEMSKKVLKKLDKVDDSVTEVIELNFED